MTSDANTAAGPWLLYDGGCPVCSSYVSKLRLRDDAPSVRFVDARQPGAELEEVREAGLDVNAGMVFKLGGGLHHGADAMRKLSLLSSSSGLFNRFSGWVLRSETRARLLYPWLRQGRDLLLVALGRRGIGRG